MSVKDKTVTLEVLKSVRSEILSSLGNATKTATEGYVLTATSDGAEYKPYVGDAAVKAWLDDHPEATTTVEDGAISDAKLSEDLRKKLNREDLDYEIVPTFSAMLDKEKSEAKPYVYVIRNDSKASDLVDKDGEGESFVYSDEPMGDGMGCWFWADDKPNGGYYREKDKKYMHAMPDQGALMGSSAPIRSIMDTFATYFNRDNLTYGRDATALTKTPPVKDDSGCFQIDCATLQYLLMYGITYDNSKYGTYDSSYSNNLGRYCAEQLPSSRGEHFLRICETVEYFAEHKRLFTIPSTADNPLVASGIQPGDILFTSTYDSETWASDYYTVGHMQMVLQTFPESGRMLIAHATGTGAPAAVEVFGDVWNNNKTNYPDIVGRAVRLTMIDFNSGVTGDHCYYKVFARPNYGKGRTDLTQIQGTYTASTASVNPDGSKNVAKDGQVYLGNFTLSSDAVTGYGKMYTLLIKGKLPVFRHDTTDLVDAYLYPRINFKHKKDSETYETINLDCRTTQEASNGGCTELSVVIPVPDYDIDSIVSVSLYGRGASGADAATVKVRIDSVEMFEGIV